MIKVATIVPQPHLHLTKDDDYFMALGHLVGKPGMEEYTEFFRAQGEAGRFVILDNGTAEKCLQPIDELFGKAVMINASELILPDIFLSGDETKRASYQALQFIKGQDTNMRTMGVPQGQSWGEWFDCAKGLLEMGVDTIGIPKVLTKLHGANARASAITRLGDLLEGKQIHLLGCWDTPLEVKIIAQAIAQKDLPEVRGVDSAIAYVHTRAGKCIKESTRPGGEPIDFEKGFIDEDCLVCNIRTWREECNLVEKGKIVRLAD